MICIECPRGCDLTVTTQKSGEIKVSGNFCPKGKVYAISEVTCPVRVITSTVKTAVGAMLPVKTDRGIKKEQIFEVMSKINSLTVFTKIKIGDIIEKNIDGEGANLVATKNSN